MTFSVANVLEGLARLRVSNIFCSFLVIKVNNTVIKTSDRVMHFIITEKDN